jgi:predicted nucleotidyltransferase
LKKAVKYGEKDTFVGLKKHTHAERSRLIENSIVPMLREELGKNLIAIAADGSYARHEDHEYSDLELMIFVRDNSNLSRGFSKIHDGMLIEGLFVTVEEYHKMINEPNKEWYIAGSDILLPITNHAFVKQLKKYRVKRLNQKCDRVALDMFNEIQESFGKLLNTINQKNRDNLFPVLADAVMCVLRLLAYTNRRPYKSLNSIMTEARTLKQKPKGFDEFLNLVTQGKYGDLKVLKKSVRQLYLGIEHYFMKKNSGNIYDGDLSTIKRTTSSTPPHERVDTSPPVPPPLRGRIKGGGY